MPNSQISNDTYESIYINEVLKQVSTQSAILAGFAFASMTSLSYDPATPWGLVAAFGICASIAVALELIALFTSGALMLAGKLISIVDEMEKEAAISWFSYLGGAIAFLAALSLISWIKIRPAAIPITIIATLTSVVIIKITFNGIAKSHAK